MNVCTLVRLEKVAAVGGETKMIRVTITVISLSVCHRF